MKEKRGTEIFKNKLICLLFFLILGLDQLSKLLVTKNLSLGSSIPVLKGIFHLTLVHNRGAAFGLLKNQNTLLILTSLFVIILIYFNFKKRPALGAIPNIPEGYFCYGLSLVLILAGALGNFIDRLCFGYVIDFLDLRIWPVFNVADSAISAGAVLLGWLLLSPAKT